MSKPRKPLDSLIILRALSQTITDLGQLSREEKNDLQRAIRHGILCKGKGGTFPILKTVYAPVGFDFARDRMEHVAELRRANMLDQARGTAKFFPWVPFQTLEARA